MADQWKSKGLYEHPAKHQAGTYGNVVLSPAGVYALRSGRSHMPCPQGWAAKIHKEEGDEKASAIIIRNVPESIRRGLKAKAALEGKSMQGLVLELITRYVSKEKENEVMGRFKVEGDQVQDTETGDWFELDSFDYGYWSGCVGCGAYGNGSAEAGDLEGDELIELQLNNLIDTSGEGGHYYCKECRKAGADKE